jgi:hypothetical protein
VRQLDNDDEEELDFVQSPKKATDYAKRGTYSTETPDSESAFCEIL